jgi:hypothetical protein
VSFDVDELSFGKEGLGTVGQGSPANAVGIFGFGEGFPAGILEGTVGRYGEEDDLAASLGSLYERVLRDVSDENDLVNGAHTEVARRNYSSMRTNM